MMITLGSEVSQLAQDMSVLAEKVRSDVSYKLFQCCYFKATHRTFFDQFWHLSGLFPL
jgi:hypothetical protein